MLFQNSKSRVAGGRWIWAICLALLVFSSPLVVRDLLTIQRMVEQTSGADFWYEGQIKRELLHYKVALQEVRYEGLSSELEREVSFQLDMVYSRLNNLPRPTSGDWHTQGLAEMPQIAMIRDELDAIDENHHLLAEDPQAFADLALDHVNQALGYSRELARQVVEQQNRLIGDMQTVVERFRSKLAFYVAGFLALLLGLGYLMIHHMRAEQNLRIANRQLTEMADGLSRARDEAVEASRSKSNFLANISHELRTPLNGIIGFSEVLSEGYFGKLNDRQKEYIDDIRRSGERLRVLINEILDLSKIEAGQDELVETEVDLGEILKSSAHDMRGEVAEASLSVTVDVPDDLPALRADAGKLRQICDNLLYNAIKFTQEGGEVRLSARIASNGCLQMSVRDTGIGIKQEDLARVFKAFEQVRSDHARKSKGAGLGLPLVKAFVDLHDGDIWIDSTVDVGTTVTVEFPRKRLVREQLQAAQ